MVEWQLPKLHVAGSIPVSRSKPEKGVDDQSEQKSVWVAAFILCLGGTVFAVTPAVKQLLTDDAYGNAYSSCFKT